TALRRAAGISLRPSAAARRGRAALRRAARGPRARRAPAAAVSARSGDRAVRAAAAAAGDELDDQLLDALDGRFVLRESGEHHAPADGGDVDEEREIARLRLVDPGVAQEPGHVLDARAVDLGD